MSVDPFYRALGLKGYDVVDCRETPYEISILVEWRCPECGGRNVELHEWGLLR